MSERTSTRAVRATPGGVLAPVLTPVITLVLAAVMVVAAAPPASAAGVDRVAGRDRWATAVRISQAMFPGGADTAWVASGTDFPDALAAAPTAGSARLGGAGPVLLSRRDSLPAVVRDELRRLGPDRIVVVGGPAAVSEDVRRDLESVAPVQRLSGANRWATAAAVSRATFPTTARTVWIASGTAYPDALAAAPAAVEDDAPILLARQDRLPAATVDELRRLRPRRIVVVGGTAAIGARVEQDLRGLAGTVLRVAGSTRYATAAQVGQHVSTRSTVFVASGRDFPGALAMSAGAAATGAPLVLTTRTTLPNPTRAALRRWGPRDVVVVGSTDKVSNPVAIELAHFAAVPAWTTSSSRVSSDRLGSSWEPGCPVPPSDLRLVRLPHIAFDGQPHTGELIVHQRVVDEVQAAFRRLYQGRFPIRRMRTVEQYGSSDGRSMDADNTSGFNCRTIAGTTSWSRHAYGLAIDINPIENPYLRGSLVSPDAGRHYVDRDDERPGMLLDGSGEVAAFTSRGFRWGGDWTSPIDYQHVDQAP